MESDSDSEMNHLREQARRLGLTIRTRRASRASGTRSYSFVERETGQVVGTDMQDLSDVQMRLWWIVRERRMVLAHPLNDVPAERCPTCTTVRVAFFRWCLSCGLDYEATRDPKPPMARRPQWNGPRGRLFDQPPPEPRVILRPMEARRSITSPLAGLAYEIEDSFRFGLLGQLVGGAVVALIVGAMVVLLVQATR